METLVTLFVALSKQKLDHRKIEVLLKKEFPEMGKLYWIGAPTHLLSLMLIKRKFANDVAFQNITRYFKKLMMDLLNKSFQNYPLIYDKNMWSSLNHFWDCLKLAIEECDSSIDMSRFMMHLFASLTDLSVLTRPTHFRTIFDVKQRLQHLHDLFPNRTLDAIISCRTLINTKYRKPEAFIHALRFISKRHLRTRQSNSEDFMKLLIIAKSLFVVQAKSSNIHIKKLWKDFQGSLVVTSKIVSWVEQNTNLTISERMPVEELIKMIDTQSLLKVLFPRSYIVVSEETESSTLTGNYKNDNRSSKIKQQTNKVPYPKVSESRNLFQQRAKNLFQRGIIGSCKGVSLGKPKENGWLSTDFIPSSSSSPPLKKGRSPPRKIISGKRKESVLPKEIFPPKKKRFIDLASARGWEIGPLPLRPQKGRLRPQGFCNKPLQPKSGANEFRLRERGVNVVSSQMSSLNHKKTLRWFEKEKQHKISSKRQRDDHSSVRKRKKISQNIPESSILLKTSNQSSVDNDTSGKQLKSRALTHLSDPESEIKNNFTNDRLALSTYSAPLKKKKQERNSEVAPKTSSDMTSRTVSQRGNMVVTNNNEASLDLNCTKKEKVIKVGEASNCVDSVCLSNKTGKRKQLAKSNRLENCSSNRPSKRKELNVNKSTIVDTNLKKEAKLTTSNFDSESTDNEGIANKKSKKELKLRKKMEKEKFVISKDHQIGTSLTAHMPSEQERKRKNSTDSESEIEVVERAYSEITKQEIKGSSNEEIDEAFGSDGDIVPCDESKSMFSKEESAVYHRYLREVEVSEKVREILSQEESLSVELLNESDRETERLRSEKEILASTEERNENGDSNEDWVNSLYQNSCSNSTDPVSDEKGTDGRNCKSNSESIYGDDDSNDLVIILDTIQRDRKLGTLVKEEVASEEEEEKSASLDIADEHHETNSEAAEDCISRIFNTDLQPEKREDVVVLNDESEQQEMVDENKHKQSNRRRNEVSFKKASVCSEGGNLNCGKDQQLCHREEKLTLGSGEKEVTSSNSDGWNSHDESFKFAFPIEESNPVSKTSLRSESRQSMSKQAVTSCTSSFMSSEETFSLKPFDPATQNSSNQNSSIFSLEESFPGIAEQGCEGSEKRLLSSQKFAGSGKEEEVHDVRSCSSKDDREENSSPFEKRKDPTPVKKIRNSTTELEDEEILKTASSLEMDFSPSSNRLSFRLEASGSSKFSDASPLSDCVIIEPFSSYENEDEAIFDKESLPSKPSYKKVLNLDDSRENEAVSDKESLPIKSSYKKVLNLDDSRENEAVSDKESLPIKSSYKKVLNLDDSRENEAVSDKESLPIKSSYKKVLNLDDSRENEAVSDKESLPSKPSYKKGLNLDDSRENEAVSDKESLPSKPSYKKVLNLDDSRENEAVSDKESLPSKPSYKKVLNLDDSRENEAVSDKESLPSKPSYKKGLNLDDSRENEAVSDKESLPSKPSYKKVLNLDDSRENEAVSDKESLPSKPSYKKVLNLDDSRENEAVSDKESLPSKPSYKKGLNLDDSRENEAVSDKESLPSKPSYKKVLNLDDSRENEAVSDKESLPIKSSYKKVLNLDDSRILSLSFELSESLLPEQRESTLPSRKDSIEGIEEKRGDDHESSNAEPSTSKSNPFTSEESTDEDVSVRMSESPILLTESAHSPSENKENIVNNKQHEEGEEIEVYSFSVQQTSFDDGIIASVEQSISEGQSSSVKSKVGDLILRSPTRAFVTYMSPPKSGIIRKRGSLESSASKNKEITNLTPLKVASAALSNEIVISPDVSDEENAPQGQSTGAVEENVIPYFQNNDTILSKSSNLEEEQVMDICDKPFDDIPSPKSASKLSQQKKSSRKCTETPSSGKKISSKDSNSANSTPRLSPKPSPKPSPQRTAQNEATFSEKKLKSLSPVSVCGIDAKNASLKSKQSDDIITRRSSRISEKTSMSPKNSESASSTELQESEGSSSQTDGETNKSEDRDKVSSLVKSSYLLRRRLGRIPSPEKIALLESPRHRRLSSVSVKDEKEASKTVETPPRSRARRNSMTTGNLTPVLRLKKIGEDSILKEPTAGNSTPVRNSRRINHLNEDQNREKPTAGNLTPVRRSRRISGLSEDLTHEKR